MGLIILPLIITAAVLYAPPAFWKFFFGFCGVFVAFICVLQWINYLAVNHLQVF